MTYLSRARVAPDHDAVVSILVALQERKLGAHSTLSNHANGSVRNARLLLIVASAEFEIESRITSQHTRAYDVYQEPESGRMWLRWVVAERIGVCWVRRECMRNRVCECAD